MKRSKSVKVVTKDVTWAKKQLQEYIDNHIADKGVEK